MHQPNNMCPRAQWKKDFSNTRAAKPHAVYRNAVKQATRARTAAGRVAAEFGVDSRAASKAWERVQFWNMVVKKGEWQ